MRLAAKALLAPVLGVLALSIPALSVQTIPMLAGQAMAQTSDRQEISYGSDALQGLDYWRGATADAPLIVYVHGGGWKRGDKDMMQGSPKLSHWQELGYAVASVNYRLVPDNTVEQQADDLAAAIAVLHSRAATLGFDADRIALIGHSAGAHLVSLVGTDESYLTTHGLSHDDIAGIVPLDGAAYDVAYQLENGARLMQRTYEQAFGDDPARHRALSPISHAATPNVAEFLILHVQRDDAREQSRNLAAQLRRSSSNAELHGIQGRGLRGHRAINRNLGEADYPATPLVDAFFARIFAE